MAGHPVAAAHVAELRLLRPAAVCGVGAASGEPAAGRRVHGTGDLSLQHAAGAGPFHFRIGNGDGGNEGLGVGVQGVGVQLLRRTLLHYLPQIHYQNTVRQVPHHGQIMGDQQIGQGLLFP